MPTHCKRSQMSVSLVADLRQQIAQKRANDASQHKRKVAGNIAAPVIKTDVDDQRKRGNQNACNGDAI